MTQGSDSSLTALKLNGTGLGKSGAGHSSTIGLFQEGKMKVVIAALGLLMLGGCATNGGGAWSKQACSKLDSDQELSLSLADDMIGEGKLHAGLANLQRLPNDLAQVRMRKAKIYRQLGQSEAEPLYRSLLSTCLAAEGEHGLGQLAASRNDNALALEHLTRAARLSPTDEKIRNDLGVVYLNQGNTNQARFEFLTAMELKQDNQLATLNLVTLLIYQGNWKQASDLVNRAGLKPEQVTSAKERAEKLRNATKKSANSQAVTATDSSPSSVNQPITQR
ncbi:Flp pilus assembly protein TadD [Pseudomonas chlororaphis subsp. piscium]|nr:Flp pilus assembly protein TadD [Pseudomonas chlororaphis subsp. piscium]AZC59028.1 Flp pilus assembly protein TadD [Pseudomonas chlororaphis subsp. piscium]AZC77701.1 Flp pilus assembly protein TadD [Pseudomonas chlororaphis subsp. piscium]